MGAVIAFALGASELGTAAGTLVPVAARPCTVDDNAERATAAEVKKRMVKLFIKVEPRKNELNSEKGSGRSN
jgi:hypothetical protein